MGNFSGAVVAYALKDQHGTPKWRVGSDSFPFQVGDL